MSESTSLLTSSSSAFNSSFGSLGGVGLVGCLTLGWELAGMSVGGCGCCLGGGLSGWTGFLCWEFSWTVFSSGRSLDFGGIGVGLETGSDSGSGTIGLFGF